ncbi:hypothetical protein [Brumimicrobium mesophilum]|uniref:hypothetical protein n=1 Tax=Brumimicrobium mesophilum TaxID=392717 RepID=UPI000D141D38|nr:hypothetical protein [Brumimicrobium mesophilum]
MLRGKIGVKLPKPAGKTLGLMTYSMKTYSILFTCLLIHFVSIAQSNDSVKLNQVIALGTGTDVNMWCGPEYVFLEVDGTTLIPFDEFRTFEMGLTLEEPILLSSETYRILLQKDNEIIQFRTFTKDSISKIGDLIVNFDFKRCCYSGDVKHVFFLKDSLVISDTYCSDKKSILQFVSDRKGLIELIGIQNDSLSLDKIQERIKLLRNFLISNGIEADRITLIEALEASQKENSFLRGSEYLAVYPENDDKAEIGVLIKVSE